MRRNLVRAQQIAVTAGKSIRDLRMERGLTASDLARLVGVTPRAMQRFETAEIPCPLHVLVAVADELDGSLDMMIPVTTRNEKETRA